MIQIRPMITGDLPFAMRLKDQAGWNQVEADWRRFLSMQPDGCFVAELGGVPVGTTVTCIFGHVAWVAMVLVEKSARGQGVGTALMQHVLAFLDRVRVRTIRLDATPLGQPIYEKLGFVREYTLARYHGSPSTAVKHRQEGLPGVAVATRGDYDRLMALDREVTGTDRRKFLEGLFRERPDGVWFFGGQEDDSPVEGYLASRAGTTALQMGPCVGTPRAGAALLRHAAAGIRSPIYVDVPHHNVSAARLCGSLGLTVQRTLVRMYRGPCVHEDSLRLMASSGPELG